MAAMADVFVTAKHTEGSLITRYKVHGPAVPGEAIYERDDMLDALLRLRLRVRTLPPGDLIVALIVSEDVHAYENGRGGYVIRTDANQTTKDNLANLPEF